MRRLRVDREAALKEVHLFMGRDARAFEREGEEVPTKAVDDEALARSMAENAMERQRRRSDTR